ncbi:MAG TPA: flagellar M-ring protein FliF [Nitrospirae bacterium]|nr:flagellar M-ring protein [bacterium BMS3Abin06]HDH10922.1 flagellar M-ring protein FliF [Nitrospirota bacterium]HDZ00416.1 flagellar M-ring protein FliF [Nitrospirota bacterium]
MAALENILENIKVMPAGKKIAILAVMVISIAGLLLLFAWIQKADYQVLYSNLSEEDAGRIVQELSGKRIPYRIGPGGAVLVSSDRVYDLRLQLAAEGLPQGGGVGFEIFDNASFTTSEFVQKLNFRRALEGELSRTIRALAGVQQSRVHLVMPDKSVFAFQDSKSEATAAVFVTLQRGKKLSRREVEGIVHLVSSSVEDLVPGNITVIDNKGELLSKPSDDSMMSLSGTQMEYSHNFEQNMMSRIVSILEPVIGRNKVKARVSAEFDFTRSERTEEIYDPEGVVVRSEQKSSEKTISGLTGGGIPGAASNLPGGAAQRSSSSRGQSQRQDEMINYETSKTVTRTVESPVTLQRLTVAILIDGILQSRQGSAKDAEQYITRSEEDVKYYEDIVRKTIGFTEERGDEISVTVMPFEAVETGDDQEVQKDYMPVVFTVLKYLVPLLVAILFFLIVLRPLVKSITSPMPAKTARAPAEGRTEIGEPLQPKEIPMEKKVIDWAAKNPQEAAGLVKGWLEE